MNSHGLSFERGYAKESRHIEPETMLVYKAEGGGGEDRDRDRCLHWCLESPFL